MTCRNYEGQAESSSCGYYLAHSATLHPLPDVSGTSAFMRVAILLKRVRSKKEGALGLVEAFCVVRGDLIGIRLRYQQAGWSGGRGMQTTATVTT